MGQLSLKGGRPARHTGPWLWLLELHAYYSPFLCSYSYKLMFIYHLFVLFHAELMLIFYRFDVYSPHWWPLWVNWYTKLLMLKHYMRHWGLKKYLWIFLKMVLRFVSVDMIQYENAFSISRKEEWNITSQLHGLWRHYDVYVFEMEGAVAH